MYIRSKPNTSRNQHVKSFKRLKTKKWNVVNVYLRNKNHLLYGCANKRIVTTHVENNC